MLLLLDFLQNKDFLDKRKDWESTLFINKRKMLDIVVFQYSNVYIMQLRTIS